MLSVTNVIQVPKSLEFEYQGHFFFSRIIYLSRDIIITKRVLVVIKHFVWFVLYPAPTALSRLFILQGYLENLIQHHQVSGLSEDR